MGGRVSGGDWGAVVPGAGGGASGSVPGVGGAAEGAGVGSAMPRARRSASASSCGRRGSAPHSGQCAIRTFTSAPHVRQSITF